MKKLLLLLFTILFTLQSYSQEIVTIGPNLTSASNVYYLPWNTYYNYSVTQQIFTASEIVVDGVGGAPTEMGITKIGFQYDYTSPFTCNGVNIYLGNTLNPSFASTTSWEPFSGLTLCYSGSVSVSATGWYEITLTTPFIWDGTSNIVVAINKAITGYPGSAFVHKMHVKTDGALHIYTDGSAYNLSSLPSGNKVAYRSNVKFTFDTPPTCFAPSNIVASNITSTNATLTLTPHVLDAGGNSYEIFFNSTNTPPTPTSVSIPVGTNTSFDFETDLSETLIANTLYYVWVRTDCGGGDYSYWNGPFSFLSACDVMSTLPWTENFDGVPASASLAGFPSCWTRNTNYSTAYYPYLSTSQSVSAPNSLYFSYGSTSSHVAAIAPPLDPSIDISTLRVSFKMRYSAIYAGGLQLGVMTDPADWTTFVPVGTPQVISAINTWESKEVMLSSYVPAVPGNPGHYIVIATTGSGTMYAYIDDFTIDYIPDCPDVYNFVAAIGTGGSVNISWDNTVVAANGWTIAYAETTAALFDPSTATQISVTAADMPYTITALTTGSTYTFAMQNACDGAWTTPVQITIPLTASLPYTQDFEDLTDVFEWNFYSSNTTTTDMWTIGSATGNPGNSLYLSADGGTTVSYSQVYTNTYAAALIDFGNYAEYAVSFDWKGMGESCCDKFSAWLVPTDFPLTQNVLTLTGAGVIQLLAPSNQQSSWQTVNLQLPATNLTGTAKKLVFMWYSDVSLITNPASAVDNIIITGFLCGAPYNIAASNITTSEADISFASAGSATAWKLYWRAVGSPQVDSVELTAIAPQTLTGLFPSTQYQVWMKGNCGADGWSNASAIYTFFTACGDLATFPWTENFDGVTASASLAGFPTCWTRNTNYSTNYYPYLSTSQSVSAPNSLYFSYGNTSSHVAAIAPKIDPTIDISTLRVSYKMRYSSLYPGGLQVGVMTDPTNWTTFVPVGTPQVISAVDVWENKEILLSSYEPAVPGNPGHYIALATTGSGTMYAYIDDFTISFIPDCPDVYNFVATVGTGGSVNISWDNTIGAANGWTIAYAETTAALFDPSTATQISVTAADMPYTIPALTTGSTYTFAMQNACDGAWTTPVQITIPITVSLPYTQNFEDLSNIAEINIQNGSNGWFIGSATGNPGNSIYISDNNGVTNSYNISLTSFSYAYIDVDFGNFAEYVLSFDWKAAGESSFDFIRVYSMPLGSTLPSSTYPSGAGVQQINADYMNQHTEWTSATYTLSAADYANQSKRIVFLWRNDGSVGTQPPGAIDNISITGSNCGSPVAITFSNLNTTSATVSWTPVGVGTSWLLSYKLATSFTWGPEILVSTTPSYDLTGLAASSNYNFRVRTICDVADTSNYGTANFSTTCDFVTAPFFENFDSYASSSFPQCWTRANPYVSGSTVYPYITSSYSSSSPNSMYYNGYGNQCIATPPFVEEVNTLELAFKLRRESVSSGTFTIGVMSNPNDMSTFIPIETYDPTTLSTWLSYEEITFATVPNGYHYIAFQQNNNTIWYYWLDDVEIIQMNPCARVENIAFSDINTTQATVSWTPIGIGTSWLLSYKLASASTWGPEVLVTPDPSYTITGLQNSSDYNVRIRSYCGIGDTSNYRSANFSTSCEFISSFPYYEGFDNYANNSFPTCWTRTTAHGTTTVYPLVVNSESNSYPQSLQFDGYNECAATPPFTGEVNTMTMSLAIKKASISSGSLSIGAMSNPTDINTFVQVLLYNPAGVGDWEALENISFASVPTGHHYIAFRQNASASGNYNLDDIEVSAPAVCPAPANMSIVTTTQNSALIKWSHSVDDLYYIGQTKPITSVTWSNSTPQIVDTFYNFAGLVAGTTYMIRVQAHCRSNLTSAWDTILVTPTGINDLMSANVRLYPNPTNNLLNVEFSNNFDQIELINLLGETIAMIDQSNFSTLSYQRKASIDVTSYPAGVYFVRLHSKEGFVTKKFVKN